METTITTELNHTYLIIEDKNLNDNEDYRTKMLTFNIFKSLCPLEVRTINSEKKLYLDVSGKESLFQRMNLRIADKYEIKMLFESIYEMEKEMQRFLIEESDIVFSPEMIFRNPTNGHYQFVCLPKTEASLENAGIKELTRFLLAHLQNSDELLTNTMYAISDMYETTSPSFKLVYEYFVFETTEKALEETKEIEEPVESYEPRCRYIPSFKEICAALAFLAGLSILTFDFYRSLL